MNLHRTKRAILRLLGREHSAPWREPLDIREDDVFLVSYPRSGNTWLRYLLANLLEPGQEWNITNLSRVVPDIHEPWPRDWISRTPRLLKSHQPYRPYYPRVIYLYRDGRDVAVSYYDFLRKLKGYRSTFDEFFQAFLDGRVPYGAWHDHVSSWLIEHPTDHLLPICYETMLVDPENELNRLGEFLHYSWEPALIATAIERSSIRKVRHDYRTLKFETHWRRGFQGGVKGGAGKWHETLSPEQNAMFWQIAGSVAARLGYSQE